MPANILIPDTAMKKVGKLSGAFLATFLHTQMSEASTTNAKVTLTIKGINISLIIHMRIANNATRLRDTIQIRLCLIYRQHILSKSIPVIY
ncbi:MAG: hypothetical protein WAR39_05035 [Prevotella sp.]